MESLTSKKCGELLIKYADGEYRSPCFGCESIGKCNFQNPCGFYAALERLWHYEDQQKNGRLLELPCAVGDMTYWADKNENRVRDFIVKGIEIQADDVFIITSGPVHHVNDFGRTVFLTREEAEEALKRMEDGK